MKVNMMQSSTDSKKVFSGHSGEENKTEHEESVIENGELGPEFLASGRESSIYNEDISKYEQEGGCEEDYYDDFEGFRIFHLQITIPLDGFF